MNGPRPRRVVGAALFGAAAAALLPLGAGIALPVHGGRNGLCVGLASSIGICVPAQVVPSPPPSGH